jgi:hypothetical protein
MGAAAASHWVGVRASLTRRPADTLAQPRLPEQSLPPGPGRPRRPDGGPAKIGRAQSTRVCGAVSGPALTDDELVAVLSEYLAILQRHPSADQMMAEILTNDFETGFVGGHLWSGLDGLRDFLSQREGFFDERHEIEELLERSEDGRDVTARTRLHFFLRRWEAPSAVSEEFTGRCFHRWRVRHEDDRWRVAAQLVERFEDLNDNAARLFSTPADGLNR